MGRRDSGVRGSRQGAGDTRHDFKIDSGLDARFGLLTAPAKQKRISAFETNDDFVPSGLLDQQRVDPVLRHRMLAGEFSDRYDFGFGSGQLQQLGRNQVIVKNDVGLTDQPVALERNQLGVTRTRAHKIDFSLWHFCPKLEALSQEFKDFFAFSKVRTRRHTFRMSTGTSRFRRTSALLFVTFRL